MSVWTSSCLKPHGPRTCCASERLSSPGSQETLLLLRRLVSIGASLLTLDTMTLNGLRRSYISHNATRPGHVSEHRAAVSHFPDSCVQVFVGGRRRDMSADEVASSHRERGAGPVGDQRGWRAAAWRQQPQVRPHSELA